MERRRRPPAEETWEAPELEGPRHDRGVGGHGQPGPATSAPLRPAVAPIAADFPRPPTIGTILADWERPLRATTDVHPALRADGGTVAGLVAHAAAVIGLQHAVDHGECEDCYALVPLADGLFAVLADGVSAATASGRGAAIACAAAARRAAALDASGIAAEEVVEAALGAADAAVRWAAEAAGVDPRSLATTLLLAHVGGGATPRVHVLSVGDCSCFAMRSPSQLALLTGAPGSTESAVRDVVPVASAEGHQRARHDLADGELLVLATDGLAADFVNSPSVRRWCWERWTTARDPLQAATALGYRRQGTSDDLAAIVVRRR